MFNPPLVYIIIVNWNGKFHLSHCLPSLFATHYTNFHVLLIDNGSKDDSLTWVAQFFPTVQSLPLQTNTGFAYANNVGLKQAIAQGAKYAVLLNNDTRVEPNWLGELVESAENNPTAAICQARQQTWDGTQQITFRFIPEWAEAEAQFTPIDLTAIDREPKPTPFASGCAMLLRCDTLNHIGLFDTDYFMYVEDVDLSLRSWIAGYQVLDVPNALLYHRMTGSPSQQNQRMYWGYRNQLTTLLKLYQRQTWHQLSTAIHKRWFLTRNRVALSGTLGALARLPKTVALRHQIQKHRQAPDSIFLDLCYL